MKNLNQKLINIKKYFLYALPAVLFFSYYPILTIGKNSSMNLEFSLPLIWLLCFAIISLPAVFSYFKTHFKKNNIFSISFLFLLFVSLSIFWSPNSLRAILTTGILWCLWISIVSIYDFSKTANLKKDKNFKQNLLKVIFISAFIICLFCWLQCILDVFNIARESTLLCLGCTSQAFGFPHPNGFAIEPQFMGNLLLVPSFVVLYLFIKTTEKSQKIFFFFISFFFIATLFLTFSRGAIYSFSVGIVVFLILSIIKQKSPNCLRIIPIIFLSFLFTLCAQGIFAASSTTNDTFLSGVSKSINQLSLGIIDINYSEQPVENPNAATEEKPVENSSTFDGYVEESTNTRLSLSSIALAAWTSEPKNFIFGFGAGSAGTIINQFSDEIDWDKEIVQNELVEIALELGLVGLLFVFAIIILIIIQIKNLDHNALFIGILCAFMISFLFFSGLPNALHIFLLPALLVFLFKENDFVINKISNHHTN